MSVAADTGAFAKAIEACAHSMGFTLFTASIVQDRRPQLPQWFICANTPGGFFEASLNVEDGVLDPVQGRSKTSGIPFAWDRSTYLRGNADDLWEDQAPFDHHTGIVVTLHLPAGGHFLLGFNRREVLPEDDSSRIYRILCDLVLLAINAEVAGHRVRVPYKPTVTGTLTTREREALSWTFEGKTAWEVGEVSCPQHSHL